MLHNTGYGPSFRRRGNRSMLTHAFMTMLGAALAAALILAFYNPASGGPGISLRVAERCPPRVRSPPR
jgi:hypothetical protein